MKSILCVGELEMKVEQKGYLNVESVLENSEKERPGKGQLNYALAWRGQPKARLRVATPGLGPGPVRILKTYFVSWFD